jgi:hypothetical protein
VRTLVCLTLSLAAVVPRAHGAPARTLAARAERPCPIDENSWTPPRRDPPAPPAPRATPADPPVPAIGRPTGFAGRAAPDAFPPLELQPLPDRWRTGFPAHDRYPGTQHERPYTRGRWWDPYDLSLLKGDYPILGQHTFLALTAQSDTIVEGRRLPTPSDVSTARAGSDPFFGQGEQLAVLEYLLFSMELFSGNAAFKPRDWELRATPVFNVNYTNTQEHGAINIDPREGNNRLDDHIGLQELFGDLKLADVGPYYDTVNVRAGIQGLISDFRGFLFADYAPALKLSGTYHANRTQWVLAYFHEIEKDTNSGLNTVFEDREQDVAIATLTRQDFLWPGWSNQLSLHYDADHDSTHYDVNGFLVRPANVGTVRPHDVRVGYLGWTSDGHIDRIGVSHAFFWALGSDDQNAIAGRQTFVNAQMAALELSYDRDWLRFVGSIFFASGDGDPTDGTARGFDAILDEPFFAGGPFSFWQRQGIKLTGTNVNLVNRGSLLPTLRSSKLEGQPNFVNPGLLLGNVGVVGRLTPKLTAVANVNAVRFMEVEPLQTVLLQRDVPHATGVDYGIGLKYRPLLIDNVIAVAGVAGFSPLAGFRSIFGDRTLWQAFGSMTFTF